MKFTTECWFPFKDIRDYESFTIEAESPKSAINLARSKYPTAMRISIKKK